MWLLVGLGNPGAQYRAHRHNVGFMVLDALQSRCGGSEWKEKFHGVVSRGVIGGQPVTMLKPSTFMNLSGRATQAAMAGTFTKMPNVIVIHDDLDLPVHDVRAKIGGGHGGHNGLRDIIAAMGAEFARVRYGIGRPTVGDVAAFVLAGFTKDEQIGLSDGVSRAADAVEYAITFGPLQAMNRYTTRPKGPAKTP